jgi:hypothetical protein
MQFSALSIGRYDVRETGRRSLQKHRSEEYVFFRYTPFPSTHVRTQNLILFFTIKYLQGFKLFTLYLNSKY